MVCFAIGSTLLAIFYGAALANVVRGVPIGNDGYFFEPLWTDWRVGKDTGILDWYTVPGGILALLALMLHGCNYIALKTSGAFSCARENMHEGSGFRSCCSLRSAFLRLWRSYPMGYRITQIIHFSLRFRPLSWPVSY